MHSGANILLERILDIKRTCEILAGSKKEIDFLVFQLSAGPLLFSAVHCSFHVHIRLVLLQTALKKGSHASFFISAFH